MRWYVVSGAALTLAGALLAGAAEKSITVEGTLVDSRCYLQDTKPTGAKPGDEKDCAAAALKGGDPAGVVTKDNKFYVLVTPSVALAEYAGMEVRVTGAMEGEEVLLTEKVEILMHGNWWRLKLPSKEK